MISNLEERLSSAGAPRYAASERAPDSLVASKLVRRLTEEVEERGGVKTLENVLSKADTSGDGEHW